MLQYFQSEPITAKEEQNMKRTKQALAGGLVCLMLLGSAGCGSQLAPVQSSVGSATTSQPASETKEPGSKGALPGVENGYLVKEPMGEEIRVDLDGDGKRETLYINTKQVQRKGSGEQWTETALATFTVNGKEFIKENDQENGSLNVPNVVLYTPESEHYFLADLDAGDGTIEIGLLDYGPSYDLTTTYLRYEDGQLMSLGTVSGFPDQDTSVLDGKGNLTTPGRLALLQNWQAPFVYQLKGSRLEQAPQTWYTPIAQPEQQVLLKKGIWLYVEPNQNAKTIYACPDQAVRSFPSTDNKHWIQVKLADGTEGWFYMEDGSTILSNGQRYTEMEVFDNLNMSD